MLNIVSFVLSNLTLVNRDFNVHLQSRMVKNLNKIKRTVICLSNKAFWFSKTKTELWWIKTLTKSSSNKEESLLYPASCMTLIKTSCKFSWNYQNMLQRRQILLRVKRFIDHASLCLSDMNEPLKSRNTSIMSLKLTFPL